MLPPWRSTLTADGDHSDPSKMLANIAARPGRIAAIAPGLCESMTTITTTAKTIVSMIGRAIGRPFAASGAATKTRQSWRISRTVRPGARNRSCQARMNTRRLSTTMEWRTNPCTVMWPLMRSEHLGDDSEGVIGILIIAGLLPLWQLDL